MLGCMPQGNNGRIDENDTIVRFSLSEGGGMNRFAGFGYDIRETKDGKVHFHFDEGLLNEKEFTLDDHSVFDSLQKLVLKHKMYQYKDWYRPEFDITDGTTWGLEVRYASGKSISSGGYMAGPKGYGDAFREIMECLKYWEDMPVASNDVVSFVYEYGADRYTIKPEGDHALLTHDNEETNVHEVLERNRSIMENLRVMFNLERLKMNETRGNLDFECTLWMYDITYTNGDHYRYESYDRDFQCGYTHILQGFISRWMEEDIDFDPKRFY